MGKEMDSAKHTKAGREAGLALRRLAVLFHAFSTTLVEELGDGQGRVLIEKAVEAYGGQVGAEAAERAKAQGKALTPENFEDDLPQGAWRTEPVVIDGEERVRVHRCPLAAEWMDWGDPALARLYCGVDQAKMLGFNPEYEYVHVKNMLDGDPYCELVMRRREVAGAAEGVEEREGRVKWLGGYYSREDLMDMDPVCLRALFRERVHHGIEVHLYPILRGEKPVPPGFGRQPRLILEVWLERGLPVGEPDIEWGRTYIELADRLNAGEELALDLPRPEAFAPEELKVVDKLLGERRSVRDWESNRPVPDELIEKVLEAGRAAPSGCNLNIVRFVVIKDPGQAKMVWSDIPTPMDRCVLIVIGYDTRVYRTVGHDRLVPHNQLFDCAAAADHMCLMAHALGLGAVWLTRTPKTGAEFKRKFGLPEHIEPALHIALGWPALGTIKSARLPLSYMLRLL